MKLHKIFESLYAVFNKLLQEYEKQLQRQASGDALPDFGKLPAIFVEAFADDKDSLYFPLHTGPSNVITYNRGYSKFFMEIYAQNAEDDEKTTEFFRQSARGHRGNISTMVYVEDILQHTDLTSKQKDQLAIDVLDSIPLRRFYHYVFDEEFHNVLLTHANTGTATTEMRKMANNNVYNYLQFM